MGRSGPTEDRRRAAGLCPHCGKPPAPGHTYCAAALEYKRVYARNNPRRRCRVCRRSWRGDGTACPGCAAAAGTVRERRGERMSLQTTMPGRAERIAHYAGRAALGLDLFR